MAAVGSDLTAIGHIAGHKNATITALYVHNSEGAARSLAEPEFWTPNWTPRPAKRPKCVHRYDLSFRNHSVGHPGLEPGANGLRKAIYDSLSPVKHKVTGS
jgi:hypothetical protein